MAKNIKDVSFEGARQIVVPVPRGGDGHDFGHLAVIARLCPFGPLAYALDRGPGSAELTVQLGQFRIGIRDGPLRRQSSGVSEAWIGSK
ncbi:MAG: hypothetical protein WCF20_09345 [Methylovirgula sp.]